MKCNMPFLECVLCSCMWGNPGQGRKNNVLSQHSIATTYPYSRKNWQEKTLANSATEIIWGINFSEWPTNNIQISNIL